MIARHSLVQRVTWALTGSVALFVVILCSVAYLAFDQMEDGLVDEMLTVQAEHLLEQTRAGQTLTAQQARTELGAPIDVWLVKDAAQAELLPNELRSLGKGIHVLSPVGSTWHVLVLEEPFGKLYLRYDATAHEARVNNFGLLVLCFGLFCILGAFVLNRWLARRAVEPLVDLTNRLSDWAPGSPDLTVRNDDEAGRLIEAFNRVQSQVEESVAYEREFSTNLSHEIRTPLTAIRSDSEMLLMSAELTPPARLRLQRTIVNVDTIVSSLVSTSNLARSDLLAPEDISIRQSLEHAWLALASEAQLKNLKLINEIPDTFRLTLDPYAVLIVMRNLIRNAIEHAAPATLTVRRQGERTITFTDNGPGISPHVLPLLFERYYSFHRGETTEKSQGANAPEPRRGLGLAIAKRVCDMHQWELRAESVDRGSMTGTTFILRF